MTMREWLQGMLHPHRDTDAARERLADDTARVELHAERIEKSTNALEARVHTNHISASIEALLRRAK